MSPTLRGSIAPAALAAVLALALAACGPQTPSPTTPPSPSASATEEPTVGHAWAYELGCADIFSPADLEATVAGAGVVVDESSAGRSVVEVAELAGGALVCEWGADGSGLGVFAVDDFTDGYAEVQRIDEAAPRCDANGCQSVELYDAIGVAIRWSVPQGQVADAASFDALRATVASAFADPAPRTVVWHAPDDALQGETYCDGGAGTSEFATVIDDALGLPAGSAISAGGRGDSSVIEGVAAGRGGSSGCGWQWGPAPDETLFVDFAPGGAWALPGLDPGYELSTFELSGFDARSGCSAHNCSVFLTAGDTLIEMTAGGPGATLEQLQATATTLAPVLFATD